MPDATRLTLNIRYENYQVYDNDNSRSVFRYFQATQSTTFNTDFNLSSGKLYKIHDIQIDSEDILYVSSGIDTLKTKIDLKANLASPTFTGTVGGITKSMVGLGNVDNTNDLNKPVSTATQTALNLKANLASPTFTGVLYFTGSRIDITPPSGNAVIQLHSDSGRYTINAQHTNGDYQVYDNDNSRSVFRYFQATQSTTFNTEFDLSSGFEYKLMAQQ